MGFSFQNRGRIFVARLKLYQKTYFNVIFIDLYLSNEEENKSYIEKSL